MLIEDSRKNFLKQNFNYFWLRTVIFVYLQPEIIKSMKIIGRKSEIDELNRLSRSGAPEFVAVYGRRRVGKTFLVKGRNRRLLSAIW